MKMEYGDSMVVVRVRTLKNLIYRWHRQGKPPNEDMEELIRVVEKRTGEFYDREQHCWTWGAKVNEENTPVDSSNDP